MYEIFEMLVDYLRTVLSAPQDFLNFLYEHKDDLTLNLLSEAIGIMVTIGLIDAWVKRREEKKWKPAIGLLFADILNISDELIFELLPKSLRKTTLLTYKFGESVTTVTVDVKEVEVDKISGEIEKNLSFYIKSSSELVDDIHKRLEYILKFSAILMQPALFNHLIQLDRVLSQFRRMRIDYDNNSDADSNESLLRDFGSTYKNLLNVALLLRSYLIKQAVEYIPRGE